MGNAIATRAIKEAVLIGEGKMIKPDLIDWIEAHAGRCNTSEPQGSRHAK